MRAIAFLFAFFLAGAASAAPIIYVVTGTASGSLGGVAFTMQAFSLVGYGDTDNVQQPTPGPFVENALDALAFVDGGSVAFLSGEYQVFSTDTGFGFNDETRGSDVLDMRPPNYDTYKLDTSIQVTGGIFGGGGTYDTTDGILVISGFNSAATLTAFVPEPASFVLVVAPLIACLALRRRRSAV